MPAEMLSIQRRRREEFNPWGGGGPVHIKFSRDAELLRISAPHLLKREQLQLAGSFCDTVQQYRFLITLKSIYIYIPFSPISLLLGFYLRYLEK